MNSDSTNHRLESEPTVYDQLLRLLARDVVQQLKAEQQQRNNTGSRGTETNNNPIAVENNKVGPSLVSATKVDVLTFRGHCLVALREPGRQLRQSA
jgi:hypothetical protein